MKPILFNTEMVRAILDGRKTVTRRAIKPQPDGRPVPMTKSGCWPGYFAIQGTAKVVRLPFLPGDVLWVRETWAKDPFGDGYIYPTEVPGAGQKWRPSIFMPREAARIFLRVTDVRVERLQSISHEDAEQEGCWCDECGLSMPDDKFSELWDRTINPSDLPAYGWDANPWVWVIEFERIGKEGE